MRKLNREGLSLLFILTREASSLGERWAELERAARKEHGYYVVHNALRSDKRVGLDNLWAAMGRKPLLTWERADYTSPGVCAELGATVEEVDKLRGRLNYTDFILWETRKRNPGRKPKTVYTLDNSKALVW